MSLNLAPMTAPLTPEQMEQAEWRIQHAGRVSMRDFQISVGVLFALASIALIGRITIRLLSRRRLYLDDGFLLLAYVSLVGATVVPYKHVRDFYAEFTVDLGDLGAATLEYEYPGNRFGKARWRLAYFILLWTVVFSVKWCYFAFFRPLLRSMSKKILCFYWVSVGFSVISWLIMTVAEQVISCPYVSENSTKHCMNVASIKDLFLALVLVASILDGLTDLTVILFPVLILRQSKMRTLTKLGLGLFLCLSIFMLTCAITRAAGLFYGGVLDIPWQVYWLHVEACIAVMMASLTVYRSTLIGSNDDSDKLQSYLFRVFGKNVDNTPGSDEPEKSGVKVKLSKLPGATLTGLRSLFGGSRVERTRTKPTEMSQGSDLESFDMNYHAHIGGKTSSSGSNGSSV